jgi:excisionase family DNA binding protein
MAPEQLWTTTEVADYLRVSRSWVYTQAEAGRLPCLHVGGLLRFEPSAVEGWLRGTQRRGALDPSAPSVAPGK